MATPALSFPSFDVDDTLGAAFIGFAFSCAVVGLNTNQVFTYFLRYPGDKIVYKLLVLLVCALSWIDQVFIGHAVYFYCITNYVNPIIVIERVPWTLIVQLTVGVSARAPESESVIKTDSDSCQAAIGTIVRLCFAMRVWRFSKRNIPVTTMVVALTLAELGFSIVYTVKSFQTPYLTTIENLRIIASLALGAGAVTDVVIACALAFFLRQYRTGSKRADSLVTTLTVYAVNTGAITAIFSVSTLVLYDLRPTTFQFLAVYFLLTKLYSVSFMCTLNMRRIVRGKGTERSDERLTTGNSLSAQGLGSRFRLYGPRTPKKIKSNEGFGMGSMAKGGLSVEIGVHQEVSVVSGVGMAAGSPYAHAYPPQSGTSPTFSSPMSAYGADYNYGYGGYGSEAVARNDGRPVAL
ncbi:hypothetical protein GGX14DRAFT_699695 [Mycena pura]|uniref:DUF6534 domain-containing protein n=1 Tax=Mycena pura TaxID=153505 RepID=A0AAD6YB59_9AGAR|nr:hypothetical protein GGX14DRAFT_699695 [Mycena pura]